jgi:hypothetical protein
MKLTPLHALVVKRLQEAKGRWPEVSRATKVPLRTLEKIARLEIPNPGVRHVERLAAYFNGAT